ncbi:MULTISPECIES: hypothetical protein [Microbacterium]|uniref:hypothetical protein n=1 Tax=Microbacterium TaxID=33882 RepID=UPI0027877D9E|nr:MULTISPECIES: hypothetical protein [Microbacterium]MDQ1084425.1 ABC-type multidrug transport system permease subunit [Microbacterium sp. SORGH_AS_0344]MDQ1170300.1 ABC-type multidrug transport system permease subunit [Microbacterium proteolyticum]
MSTTPPPPEPYTPPPTRSEVPAAPGGYAAPAYAPEHRAPVSKRLGIIAFVASLLAVVVGAILAYTAGLQAAGIAQYVDPSAGQVDPESLPPEVQQSAVAVAGLSVAAFAIYGILGLWGFIQGIIAAVKNRGRGWGIAAIIIAVLGGIVVIAALSIGAAAGVGSTL